MEPQHYGNHRRLHPPYHFFMSILVILVLAGSLVNAWNAFDSGKDQTAALLLVGMAVLLGMIHFYFRSYAAKVQDRAIRAEENLRHFVLTGKLPDASLSIKQIVALRFAGDEEFPPLARLAADSGLTPDAIKKSVKNWRPDHYRI
jgi:divalent metal cation (Fe/Co/Zn/Cd) transporter